MAAPAMVAALPSEAPFRPRHEFHELTRSAAKSATPKILTAKNAENVERETRILNREIRGTRERGKKLGLSESVLREILTEGSIRLHPDYDTRDRCPISQTSADGLNKAKVGRGESSDVWEDSRQVTIIHPKPSLVGHFREKVF